MLFVGCVFDHLYPDVGAAAYETVKACGRAVSVFRDASCCGLPALVSGDRKSALANIESNLKKLRAAAPGTIVFPCGSCLLMFKRNLPALFKEGHPLREDALFVAERAVDYASFLLDSGVVDRLPEPPAAERPGEIGYHDSCHLTGTLEKGKEPRKVLARAVGDAFREMEGADLCCGYGGTFNIRDYPTSAKIGENKVTVAAKGGTKIISTACSGCVLQMRDMAARTDPSLRVVHIAELVRHALSGERGRGPKGAGGRLIVAKNMARNRLLGDRIRAAETFFGRLRGLLRTEGLAPGEGLWIAPCRAIHSFGMRFEFDAVFLDADRKVVGLCERFRRNRSSRRFRDARGVLELPAGTIRSTGTEVGDEIRFETASLC